MTDDALRHRLGGPAFSESCANTTARTALFSDSTRTMTIRPLLLLAVMLGGSSCRSSAGGTPDTATFSRPVGDSSLRLVPPVCLAASTSADPAVRPLLKIMLDSAVAQIDTAKLPLEAGARLKLRPELDSANAGALRAVDGSSLGASAHWIRRGDSLNLTFGSTGRQVVASFGPGPTGLSGWFVTHADFSTDSLMLVVYPVPCRQSDPGAR